MSRETSADDPRIGQVIDDRYRLVRPLGRGGMGAVYLAEHTAIKREVALKLLAPKFHDSTDADRQRFEREAFATGRLKHPNCVAITDFGSLEDGGVYLVMELLDGEPLSALLEREGRLSPARALHIARHILAGLAHAHELGVVHRDLKPQNVMVVEHLGDPDFAKVLDFGLAKLLGEAQLAEGGGKLTAAGVTFGTPHYMSPEQAFGKPVDHRADLYALSVMLFEMLAGSPPFDGDDIRAVLMAHATRAVPRIHEVAPGVTAPVEVEMLVRQGLAKDPRDRMTGALEYIAGIDRCLAQLETQTTSRLPTVDGADRATGPDGLAGRRPPVAVLAASSSAPAGNGDSETRPLGPAPTPAPAAASPSATGPTVPATGSIAMPARRTRGWLWGAAGAGLLALVAVVAISAGGGDSAEATIDSAPKPAAASEPASPVVPAPAPLPKSEADPSGVDAIPGLAEAIAIGKRDSREGEKRLKALRKVHPDAAVIPYALGILYHDRPWPPEELKAYEEAIELDPSYRSDQAIIVNAIEQLSSHSSRWKASRLLERSIGEPALPYLDQTAEGHANPKIRQRAAAIAKKIRAR